MDKYGYAGTLDLDELDALRERVSRAEAERDRCVKAIDHNLVICGELGVFNVGDDPLKAIKMLMDWQGGVSEYFAKEKYEKIIAERDKTIAEQGRRIQEFMAAKGTGSHTNCSEDFYFGSEDRGDNRCDLCRAKEAIRVQGKNGA